MKRVKLKVEDNKMSVKVEKLETNLVELEIEIDKEAFESAMQPFLLW